MSASRYVRRPRTGERLESRYGVVTVQRVLRHGLVLEVATEAGGQHRLERAPTGWWFRCAPASAVGVRVDQPEKD